MKPKHLFYALALGAFAVAIAYAFQRSFGMASLAAVVALCSLLNTLRRGADRAASRSDIKRFFGIQ